MMGAQTSIELLDKITSYLDVGKQEGVEFIVVGEVNKLDGELESCYYVQSTIFKEDNSMCIFQKEIFGLVLSAI